MRTWMRPAGEPGDLPDFIIGTLALASVQHHRPRVGLSSFFKLFAQLGKEFPGVIPEFNQIEAGSMLYARLLGDALEEAELLGVEIVHPRFQYLQVPSDRGRTFLDRLRRRTPLSSSRRSCPLPNASRSLSRKRGSSSQPSPSGSHPRSAFSCQGRS